MQSMSRLFLLWSGTGSVVRVVALNTRTTSSASSRPDTSDYKSLLLNNAALLDVRAPCEFIKGSLPMAHNIPVMTDEERHQVGLCYKTKGPQAAIALGHDLVSGQIRMDRLQQWSQFCRENPSGYLYCFRGGLRSQLVQRYLQQETGIRYPLVTGGYKAMRTFCLEQLDHSLGDGPSNNTSGRALEVVVIGGATGTGKTRVIEKLLERESNNTTCSKHDTAIAAIDLEGLAHHRGSTFGRWPEDPLQPSQIDFENSLSIQLLKVRTGSQIPTTVFVEDEGPRIGNLCLPTVLKVRMKAANIAIVEEDMQERVDVILEDYVVNLQSRFVALHGDEIGRDLFSSYITEAIGRLRNRLGGARYEKLHNLALAALKEQASTGDLALHRILIATLLEQYYDPMYEYQLSQRQDQVVFRGDRAAVIEWAMSKHGSNSAATPCAKAA